MVLPTRLAGLTLLVGVTTALHPSASASRLPTVAAPAGIACAQHQPLLHGTPKSAARITVTYQDADIRDVLAAFASFAGRTIKVGKAVHGSVTTEIRDQPWDVGLQSILVSQQLAASEDPNGVITVDNCTKK
jgi:type IV pilus assembly protein PilQ